MTRILIVRLGSLGDLVHTLPAAAALRERYPSARLEWIVDASDRRFLDLVPILDDRLVWRGAAGPLAAIGDLRRRAYDAVYDFQGLMKSAVLARLAGGRRTLGFARAHLREAAASLLYTETRDAGAARHVIEKNLRLVAPETGDVGRPWSFPLVGGDARAAFGLRDRLLLGHQERVALVNPGASWPTKRWPADRFGGVAAHLQRAHQLTPVVLWGPGEAPLAQAVVDASRGAARLAPPTDLAEVLELCRLASLMVSGDTGPVQLAGAVGTPLVSVFGPTDPRRNGPWAPDDVSVARFEACRCHHQRRCRARAWCLADVTVADVCGAVDRRLEAARASHASPARP